MNTVPTITAGAINGMTGLKDRPVFFLSVNGSRTTNLVVKGELRGESTARDLQTSIAWSAKLMKNVNHSLVNTKIMSSAEEQAFCDFATRIFAPGTMQHKRVTAGRNTFIWVKMPFVAGLSDADLYTAEDKIKMLKGKATNLYEIKKVKSSLASLLNEKVWNDLGKIVAVDVFNGNRDRFHPDTGNWVNKGNVMFLQNGTGGAIGLDTWDSANMKNDNAFSNLNTPGHYDSLKTLIDPGYRHSFASKCLISMGEEFQTAMERSGMESAIFHMAGTGSAKIELKTANIKNFFVQTFLLDFSLGLQQGADELKHYLQGKVRQYQGINQGINRQNQPAALQPRAAAFGQHRPPPRPTGQAPTSVPKHMPIGVVSRMQYLGW